LDQLYNGVIEGVKEAGRYFGSSLRLGTMSRLFDVVVVDDEGFAFRDCLVGFLLWRSVHPSVIGAYRL